MVQSYQREERKSCRNPAEESWIFNLAEFVIKFVPQIQYHLSVCRWKSIGLSRSAKVHTRQLDTDTTVVHGYKRHLHFLDWVLHTKGLISIIRQIAQQVNQGLCPPRVCFAFTVPTSISEQLSPPGCILHVCMCVCYVYTFMHLQTHRKKNRENTNVTNLLSMTNSHILEWVKTDSLHQNSTMYTWSKWKKE